MDLEIARETLFFPDNLYPARNINMWKDKEMQKTVLLDFLNKNKIKFVILKHIEILPNCLKIKKLNTIKHRPTVRNFFHKANEETLIVFEILSNSCI